MSTRPLIAINGELELARTPISRTPTPYAEALQRAGAVPLILPPLPEAEYLSQLLERVDGLLFAGGDDFDTEALGLGPTHPAAKPVPGDKQAFDLALARAAIEGAVPVLGICYGMQLLGLAEGAGIHQHLPEDRPGLSPHAQGVRHDVRIEPGSKLAQHLAVPRVSVISRHHQALSSVGHPWHVSARDDEDLIEGIERREHPFAVGVQWHPELEAAGTPHDGLFEALVHAAREHASTRRHDLSEIPQ